MGGIYPGGGFFAQYATEGGVPFIFTLSTALVRTLDSRLVRSVRSTYVRMVTYTAAVRDLGEG